MLYGQRAQEAPQEDAQTQVQKIAQASKILAP
jgi:hypothetical protein